MAKPFNRIWNWYYYIRYIKYDIVQRTNYIKNIGLFIISNKYYFSSNFLEMRKADLVKVGDELYEVIRRFSVYKFSTEITGGRADLLKEWVGAEKILRNQQTNEYLFVNKIEDLEIL